jgi:hypothetical protein
MYWLLGPAFKMQVTWLYASQSTRHFKGIIYDEAKYPRLAHILKPVSLLRNHVLHTTIAMPRRKKKIIFPKLKNPIALTKPVYLLLNVQGYYCIQLLFLMIFFFLYKDYNGQDQIRTVA